MKRGKGILFFTGILLLLLAAPLYAYQNVNGNPPSCLDCHAAKYAYGTTWHTSHQGYAGSNNCTTTCHTNGTGAGNVVPTSNCATCHNSSAATPVSLPCDWVQNHEARSPNTCITCHTDCQTTPPGPCPAQATLGEDDPRLDTLREFRDDVLAKSPLGQKLITLYYKSGDAVVEVLEKNPELKQYAKEFLETILPYIEMITSKQNKKK
ncbi:MAG: hypothetical protein NTZ51_12060 [Proteobacteria bacterium]|nr:hypothetical protein [Pseudomonadota bacterium]